MTTLLERVEFMEETRQFYAANQFRLCVDEVKTGIKGRVYTPLAEKEFSFSDMGEVLLKMDKIFDVAGYPQGFQTKRTFDVLKNGENAYRGVPKPLLDPAAIRQQQGRCATYDVRVLSRRNTTWQGEIYNLSGEKQGHFKGEVGFVSLLLELM